MAYYGLLTLDLPDVEVADREKFYLELRKSGWKKIQGLTTTWKKTFQGDLRRGEVVAAIKSDLENALYATDINDTQLTYAFQIGISPVILY